jgi:hypothetical protein
MRYQLTSPWPVGAVLIPVSTIIDDSSNDDWSLLVKSLQLSPPLSAIPLDQASWSAFKMIYGGLDWGANLQIEQLRYVITGPGVRR